MELTLNCIWPQEQQREKNSAYLFVCKRRRSGKRLRLWLCAENNYRIYLNGEYLGYGPSRCAHGMAQVDEFLLDEQQKKTDSTVIAVEVAAYGISALNDADDPPFFAARLLDETGTGYAESEDFTAYRITDFVQAVPRYSWQRYFLECYRMQYDRRDWYMGEVRDLVPCRCERVPSPRLSMRNVPYPTYECSFAEKIEEGSVRVDETLPLYGNRFLDERVGENGFMPTEFGCDPVREVCRYTYSADRGLPNASPYALYDFGVNRSGFFGLRLHVKHSARLTLIWDELLNQEGHINPLRTNMANLLSLELAAGEYCFESFQPYTARYLSVAVRKGEAEITSLYMRRLENPNAERLKFEIQDSRYQTLMQAARRTFAQNAVDLLTDCPSRERVGWLCDSYFIGAAEQIFCGENPVERHFLENYADAPQAPYIPKGMLPMSYPGYSVSKNYICNWALWYILELRAYLARTEDRELIERSRPKVLGVLSCLQGYENELGFLENVPGWVFVEWSRANEFTEGVNFPSNMLYCAALEAAGELYGDKDFGLRAARLRKNLERLSRGDGLFFCDHALRKNGRLERMSEDISETCQYYAFFFGFADARKNAALLELLLREFGADREESVTYPQVAKSNAFIGNLLRLCYLSQNGFEEEALQQTVDYYLHQAERTGTLWEYAEEYKSCNHGFASYIAEILLRGLVGYHGLRGNSLLLLPRVGKIDCRVELPLSDTDCAILCVKDGVRTVELPQGYTCQILS